MLACGETASEPSTNPESGAPDATGEPCSPSAVPPDPRNGSPVSPIVLALRSIDFGLPEPIGSTEGWSSLGFDLDCCAGSGCESACTTSIADDATGIDNAFGGQLLPLLDQSEVHVEPALESGVQIGAWTLLIRVDGDASVQIHWATSAVPPTFDGSDVWSPIGSGVEGASAYVASGALVIHAPRIELPFRPDYPGPRMVLLDAALSLTLDAAAGEHAGALGGSLVPEALAFEFYEAIAAGDPAKCPPFKDRFADAFTDISSGGSDKCTHVSLGARVAFTEAVAGTAKPEVPYQPVCD